jgi:hypothetical protein
MTEKREVSNVLFNVGLFLVVIGVAAGFLNWAMISEASVQTTGDTRTTQATASPSASAVPSPSPKITQPVKVLSIAYYPLRDGRLDTVNVIKDTYAEYNFSLPEIQRRVKSIEKETEKVLEEGSAYTPYKTTQPDPYIDYQVIDRLEVQESVPLSAKEFGDLPLPDYKKMAERWNFCDWVDNKNVREIWLWTYGGTGKAGWTSNFSSKYGDFSNSDWDPSDLPVCSHSYTVYDYNYGRTASEAVTNHGFQYEALFGHLNNELFWQQFAGSNSQILVPGWDKSVPYNVKGCGWTAAPPNGEGTWEFTNQEKVKTRCADWTVYLGDAKQPEPLEINCTIWGCNQLGYYTWWMQQIPGYGNTLSYRGKKMRNWWEFIVDFDAAMEKGQDLVEK